MTSTDNTKATEWLDRDRLVELHVLAANGDATAAAHADKWMADDPLARHNVGQRGPYLRRTRRVLGLKRSPARRSPTDAVEIVPSTVAFVRGPSGAVAASSGEP